MNDEKIQNAWDKKDHIREYWRERADGSRYKEQQKNMNTKNPYKDNYIGGESGILLGKKWTDLNPRERNLVKKAFTESGVVKREE